jgi:hypothetical protein
MILMTETDYILCKTGAEAEEVLDNQNTTIKKNRL